MALRMIKKPKKKKRMMSDHVQSVCTVPTRLTEEQVQTIKMLQEEAAKDGRYIDCVYF